MRLEEGVCFSGLLDPNWGRQGRGVCGEANWLNVDVIGRKGEN